MTGTSPKPAPSVPAETLEDIVYRSSIFEGNSAFKRGNPWVTIPSTALLYGAFICLGFAMANHTETGKKSVHYVGIDLVDKVEGDGALPQPPAPAPPAPAAGDKTDAGTPTDLAQPVIPDSASKDPILEHPREIQGAPNGVPGGLPGGVPGGVPGGLPGGVPGGVVGGIPGGLPGGTGTGGVLDINVGQIKVKFQPPQPPYPRIAKLTKSQGTVVVETIIGPDGVPTEAIAKDGPPQLRAFAAEWVKAWRFEPHVVDGQARFTRFRLSLTFTLN